MYRNLLPALLILLVLVSSCNHGHKPGAQRDDTINRKTSYNNLFLDSTAIAVFLDSNPDLKKYEQQFVDFYRKRNFEYAWFDSNGLADQSHNFINLLNNAIASLNDSSLYNADLYDRYDKLYRDNVHTPKDISQLKSTELLFTGQFFNYAAKVYKGSDVDAEELGWFIPRKKVNLAVLLDSSLKDKASDIDKYVTQNSQYNKLKGFLNQYFELQKKTQDQWDSIPAPPKLMLKRKQSSALIPLIKERLSLLGDLTITDSTPKYDSALFTAVKKFQRRMGLSVDGVIGARLIMELNVPVKQRIQQLLVNMERARWMPPENDTNYIVVNIPEYKMHVYDSGHQVFDMNVIVGKTTSGTVIFNGNLKYIVFSPFWNVPPDIVQKEIVPAMKTEKNYLQKNNMEITGKSKGLPVVRQKPGPNNSLGLVKFLFPNSYDIYFHDTPNHELFNASSRSFSHGCIRLGEPKKFAQYLLRSDTAKIWKSNVIDSSMHLKKERWVSLKKPVPVFIVYFTAWVDKNGILNFRKDIYGHDEKMIRKLFVNKY